MSIKTVLVTGGTGFLGAHIVSQLLEKGYTVRATTRTSSKLQAIFPKATAEQLQIVEVPTLTSDHSAALKGVDALIHAASPIYGEGVSGQELFAVLSHLSSRPCVKKIVVTGTFVNLFDADFKAAFGTKVITEKDFGSITADKIDLNNDGIRVYQESKTAADKAIWEIAHKNPDVDFTVLLPPAIFGPILGPLSSSLSCLSTNIFLKNLFAPEYPPNPIGHMIDARDAARAHVLALTTPPVPGRDKRFIIANGSFLWEDVVAMLRSKKPELSSRLPRETSVPGPQTCAPLDTTFAKEVLGMKEYISQEASFLATVDVVLEWEKKFENKA
ncbi:hypothetical protein FB446DRAFT_707109 [Lentinula raphanica]|nr:hypothetical protein FB446DRAFT_707109 [Lentinula raphanica]